MSRYVLREPIAVGGMATVYFARGPTGTVAVKRMRPDLVHQREFVEMFIDEARLASRIHHRNVVPVVDVVANADEVFLVMDYVHGESLANLLRGGPPAPAIAIAIVMDLLHGLHAAHEALDENGAALGIVHRDVSPHNLLVGADGVARVLDFGVAKATRQLHATQEGKTRGKPRYMAPEQVRGMAVTRQTDLFAASVVLWEALTGESLFAREADDAAMLAILQEPITPPGIRVPALPEALDDVVMRGLEREPRNRWPNAAAMAEALRASLAPATAEEVAQWVSERAGPALAARAEAAARAAKESVRPSPVRDKRLWAVAAGVGIALVVTPPLLRPADAPAAATVSRAVDLPAPPTAAPVEAATSAEIEAVPPAVDAATPKPAVPHGPRKKPTCDRPYDVTPTGKKIFRVECL